MKGCILVLLLLVATFSMAQKVSFSQIDWQAQNIDAPTVDSLAKLLTSNYNTDLEKVRSIYTWVATHIYYNTGIFTHKPSSLRYKPDPDDTSTVWKSADEMLAQRVLKRKVAVCDGYASLFKTLCDYSGIKAECVLGYVRGGGGMTRFRTNHTWNAVYVDSSWHLIDATWGAGYCDYQDNFVQRFDDYYFFPAPGDFIKDHFPEDSKWTLLDNPPVIQEFKRSPLKAKAFVKYGIAAFTPSNGLIKALPGDTIRIELDLQDIARTKTVGSSFYEDSLPSPKSTYALLEPVAERGNKIFYNYVVSTPEVAWLQVLYNKDMILQYRLEIKPASIYNSLSINK
jgi:hypothetical protein